MTQLHEARDQGGHDSDEEHVQRGGLATGGSIVEVAELVLTPEGDDPRGAATSLPDVHRHHLHLQHRDTWWIKPSGQ